MFMFSSFVIIPSMFLQFMHDNITYWLPAFHSHANTLSVLILASSLYRKSCNSSQFGVEKMVALTLEVVFSKDSDVTPMMLVKILGKKTWSSSVTEVLSFIEIVFKVENKLFLEVLEVSLDRIMYSILCSYDLLRMMHTGSW